MTRRAAFIDVGTNTILCLIAELRAGRTYAVLDDLAEITRLGQGVEQTSRIGLEGEQRTLKVLRRYLERCKELGVREVFAVGTSALREAINSSEVRTRVREQLGLNIRVLSGAEEAAYSFAAVQNGLTLTGREFFVVDIGGGSTEFIWGNDSGIQNALSLKLGSVWLTERFLHSDPVTEEECGELRKIIDRELTPLAGAAHSRSQRPEMVGIAGTFTTLAAVEKKLIRYSHADVHGSVLTAAAVQRQRELFQRTRIAERKRIPGLEPKRAEVIFAGALLIERIMALFRANQVIVSDQGVRYGLLYEELRRERREN